MRCGTFCVAPVGEPDPPTAWICVADYIDGEGERCRMLGVGSSSHDAREDVREQLLELFEGPIALDEAFDPSERRVLLWSAKSRVLQTVGVMIEEVAPRAAVEV